MLAGGFLIIGFEGLSVTQPLVHFIEKKGLAGVILYRRNIESLEQLKNLTAELQKLNLEAGNLLPLIIAIDEEGGLVSRFPKDAIVFPGNMALGACGSPDLVREVAKITGIQLLSLGINLNLAPVLDLATTPANPQLGTRSFGDDPEIVSNLGSAFIEGSLQAGIMPCVKHFPGLGDAILDTHLDLATISTKKEIIFSREIIPFQNAIKNGAEMVMVSHAYFSDIDKIPTPASFSPNIINTLLRQKLNFDGVVLTDDLEMGAIGKWADTIKPATKAFIAGNDMILISRSPELAQSYIKAIELTSSSDDELLSLLNSSFIRINKFRKKIRALSKNKIEFDADQARNLCQVVANRSITLSPPDKIEEIRKIIFQKKVCILLPKISKLIDRSSSPLIEFLHYNDLFCKTIFYSRDDLEQARIQLEKMTKKNKALIVVSANAFKERATVDFLNYAIAISSPSILIAGYDPADGFLFSADYLFFTYDLGIASQQALVDVLLGKFDPVGKLPVNEENYKKNVNLIKIASID